MNAQTAHHISSQVTLIHSGKMNNVTAAHYQTKEKKNWIGNPAEPSQTVIAAGAGAIEHCKKLKEFMCHQGSGWFVSREHSAPRLEPMSEVIAESTFVHLIVDTADSDIELAFRIPSSAHDSTENDPVLIIWLLASQAEFVRHVKKAPMESDYIRPAGFSLIWIPTDNVSTSCPLYTCLSHFSETLAGHSSVAIGADDLSNLFKQRVGVAMWAPSKPEINRERLRSGTLNNRFLYWLKALNNGFTSVWGSLRVDVTLELIEEFGGLLAAISVDDDSCVKIGVLYANIDQHEQDDFGFAMVAMKDGYSWTYL